MTEVTLEEAMPYLAPAALLAGFVFGWLYRGLYDRMVQTGELVDPDDGGGKREHIRAHDTVLHFPDAATFTLDSKHVNECHPECWCRAHWPKPPSDKTIQ